MAVGLCATLVLWSRCWFSGFGTAVWLRVWLHGARLESSCIVEGHNGIEVMDMRVCFDGSHSRRL